MKKILSFLVIAGIATLVSCGPSAEEKAAVEKARQDSIQAAMDKMTADSLASVQASAQKMMQDSIAHATAKADSMAAAAKSKPKMVKKPVAPKTQQEKVQEQIKKVAGGRGN